MKKALSQVWALIDVLWHSIRGKDYDWPELQPLYAINVRGIVWGGPMPDPPEIVVGMWMVQAIIDRAEGCPIEPREDGTVAGACVLHPTCIFCPVDHPKGPNPHEHGIECSFGSPTLPRVRDSRPCGRAS